MKESFEQKIAFYLCFSETDAPKSRETDILMKERQQIKHETGITISFT